MLPRTASCGGVVDEDVDPVERFVDVLEHRHTGGLGTPGQAVVLAGRRPAHGGAEIQVVGLRDRFCHRATGPAGRTRHAHVKVMA